MDSESPYRPPASDVGGPTAGRDPDGFGGVTPGIVESLKKTRPWVLFMGIMILLGCALMVLMGLVMMFAIGFMPGLDQGAAAGLPGIGLGLVYFVLAALYLYPAIRLLRYGGAIGRILDAESVEAIEEALKQQLAFWRFVGLVTIAILVLYALLIVTGMVVAILSSV